MNRIVALLIVFTLSSCQYFNVSPANGISTKNIEKKPNVNDFVGHWEIDKTSYAYLKQKKFNRKTVSIEFFENGTFSAKNVPNLIVTNSKTEIPQYSELNGNWSIERDMSNEYWTLLLTIKMNKSINFDIYLREEKLILWTFIGDPDSGEYLLYRKS